VDNLYQLFNGKYNFNNADFVHIKWFGRAKGNVLYELNLIFI